jgi:adenosine deaminase
MDYRDTGSRHDESDGLYQTLKALPKIDLHRHLEGSLRLSTMAEIAHEHQFDLPGYAVEEFRHLVQMTPNDEAVADAFIAKFDTLRNFYRSPEIIDRITYEVVADAADDNVVYLELRFTPIALARQMRFPLREVVGWVLGAVRRAEQDYPIDVRLLVSMNRHESVELGHAFVELAAEHMGQGVVGLDLAGAENRFSGAPFAGVFDWAREAGLNITAHAAEWAGPESALEAIEVLRATRLGHGVRIIEDMRVVELARERDITLEICPTSNVQTGVVASLDKHPLGELYRMGLLTTINTDDPSVSGICLTDEYASVIEHLGFTLGDIKQNLMNAARAAFLPSAERDWLVKRMQADLEITT